MTHFQVLDAFRQRQPCLTATHLRTCTSRDSLVPRDSPSDPMFLYEFEEHDNLITSPRFAGRSLLGYHIRLAVDLFFAFNFGFGFDFGHVGRRSARPTFGQRVSDLLRVSTLLDDGNHGTVTRVWVSRAVNQSSHALTRNIQRHHAPCQILLILIRRVEALRQGQVRERLTKVQVEPQAESSLDGRREAPALRVH